MDRSCVMQLNSLVEDYEAFRRVNGKVGRQSSMLHIMVLLKFLYVCSVEISISIRRSIYLEIQHFQP